MAVAFLDGKVGFARLDEDRAHAPDLVAMAETISYAVAPGQSLPERYTGQITVTLKDGRVIVKFRPNFRSGAHLQLSDEEVVQK